MLLPFDIMRIVQNEEPMLLEGAPNLEDAMLRANALRESAPGDYLVVRRATGKKILFSANGAIRRT